MANTKPFPVGSTYHGAAGTIDTDDYAAVNLEGMEVSWRVTATDKKSKLVRARIMRNCSGISLQPGTLVAHQTGYRRRRVDGYTCVDYAEAAGVVDDRLGYSVRNGDLFLCIYDGPSRIKTKQEAESAATYSAGDILYAATQSASTAAATLTGGHAMEWDGEFNLTATSTGAEPLKALNVARNAVAVAVSSVAATTDVGALKDVLMCIRG